MSVTVVGSIAFDAVRTPFGERERMLGGAAVHFALAASLLTEVRVVGPVGDDFGAAERAVLTERGIDLGDVDHVAGGRTFSWRGHYDEDLNVAHTDDTQLNVFGDFSPRLSGAARGADVLFLANIVPAIQRQVRDQCPDARFVALDSMNLWIATARDDLVDVISSVDCVLLNDAEIRQLAGTSNLLAAAREVRSWGPRIVVAKRGEYGATLFTDDGVFSLPAYPVLDVVDPTGAGDSFAGGFVGYLAATGGGAGPAELRQAMALGTTLASFNVEAFGTERVRSLSAAEVTARVGELAEMTRFVAPTLPLPTER